MLQKYLVKGSLRKVFAILLVLVVTRARAFFNPPPVPDFSNFPFQKWLLGPIVYQPYMAFWFNIFIIFGLAMGFNYALRYYRYVPFRSFTGVVIIILLFGHAPCLLTLHPLVLPTVFLSISMIFSLRMSNARENTIQVYWAAFFIGLAALSYPLTGVFIVYVFLATAVNSILGWRELIVTIIGFFNPILLILGGLYFFDKPVGFLWQQIQNEVHFPQIPNLTLLEWAFVVTTSLLSIWVFFNVASLAGKKPISFRKYTWLHIWFLIVSIFSSFGSGHTFIYYLSLLSIPLSSFLAVYYSEENRSIKSELVFLLMICIALIQNNLLV
ncbi:MAG: hypothetical protein PWR20_748 [Bacteroidales bacterium]|jgi:hypothetical protein|nr:hypothetical protein [Bacteroidales bacterium]MDN5329196.1 hypothetical protein [Bacteroidales bacterium]